MKNQELSHEGRLKIEIANRRFRSSENHGLIGEERRVKNSRSKYSVTYMYQVRGLRESSRYTNPLHRFEKVLYCTVIRIYNMNYEKHVRLAHE
jgi:ribosomal protein L19E